MGFFREERHIHSHVAACEDMVRQSMAQTIQEQIKRLESINEMRHNPLLEEAENRINAAEKNMTNLAHQFEVTSLKLNQQRRLETIRSLRNNAQTGNAYPNVLNN